MKISGYNKLYPKKENYLDFEAKITQRLSDLNIRGLSLMIYGSYVRGDCNFGRSDIDGVMVFPDDVVINKDNLLSTSQVLADSLKGNPITFQVTVTDLKTMQDGRFNSYDKSFREYFKEEGKLLVGPDYRDEFTYELPTMDDQSPVRFNLRKSRLGLLFSMHDMNDDYTIFLNRFNKTLDSVSRGSKQILHFMDGNLRKNRFSALEEIPKFMPEVNTEPLAKIKKLYQLQDQHAFFRLYTQPAEVINLWSESLTFFEQMIKGYMDRVPNPK